MHLGLTLLNWYDQHGRKLPWRETRDPYRILVSEIMLQQTQVERVKTFYHRWLELFPDWQTLAKADNTQIIHAWAGLGYNRRGLMLRDIAKHVATHGIPTNENDWRLIKGIGPYTAAALSAFALKQRTLPVDTNIRRVLGRVLLGVHFPQLTDDEEIKTHLEEILPVHGRFYDVPQAIFDLATSICTKTPQCAICPLKDQCKAASDFLSGTIETPKKTIKTAKEKRHRDKPFPDRIYRGRILSLIRTSKTGMLFTEIGHKIDPSFKSELDNDWLKAMIERMQKDEMVIQIDNRITLAK